MLFLLTRLRLIVSLKVTKSIKIPKPVARRSALHVTLSNYNYAVLIISLTLFFPVFLRTQSPPHGITLSWVQGVPNYNCAATGITGNSIYRSFTTGGPYTQLFVSTVPITTYFDPQIDSLTGQKLFYVVTATDCDGEGPRSDEVQSAFLCSKSRLHNCSINCATHTKWCTKYCNCQT